jgi:predicted hydrolase (HD superfamily)
MIKGESLVYMKRDEARTLMRGSLEKESLRVHCLATAAIMKVLAVRMGGGPGALGDDRGPP